MKPLIVLTNDDGIASPGLRAAARAMLELGEVLIVAPKEQQSSVGRAFLRDADFAEEIEYLLDGARVRAFAAPSSPAVAVRHALLLIAKRKPALVLSGINYGENIGNGVTISGTVGAAIEAATLGAPALAVSVATAPEYHRSHSEEIDFTVAAHFARQFAAQILRNGMPRSADVLNVNVPQDATEATPWRWARVSRASYFHSTWKETPRGREFTGYTAHVDLETLEKDSDVHALIVEKIVSVTPLTYDLTARVEARELEEWAVDSER